MAGRRVLPVSVAAVAAGALLLTGGAGRAAAAAGAGSTPRHPDQVLSNERTFTRWAYVARVASGYVQPTASSEPVARLHWLTEDQFPGVYLVLRAHWDPRGREWVQLRIPMRPN